MDVFIMFLDRHMHYEPPLGDCALCLYGADLDSHRDRLRYGGEDEEVGC